MVLATQEEEEDTKYWPQCEQCGQLVNLPTDHTLYTGIRTPHIRECNCRPKRKVQTSIAGRLSSYPVPAGFSILLSSISLVVVDVVERMSLTCCVMHLTGRSSSAKEQTRLATHSPSGLLTFSQYFHCLTVDNASLIFVSEQPT